MSDPFVHLHVHSAYSTLDSTIRTKDLCARAAELGMPAVALTDHGNLYGAIEFYQNAHKAGIKNHTKFPAPLARRGRIGVLIFVS